MQNRIWTIASIKSHQSDLKQKIHALIPLKDSFFNEAYARGHGLRTQAALVAALKTNLQLPTREFSNEDFSARIAELTDDITAEAILEILEDVKFSISVEKFSEQRQRHHIFSDVEYDVAVSVSCPSLAQTDLNVFFHLPEYGQGSDMEPYRVDSAHDRRAEADYHKTRSSAGKSTLIAKLVEGHWNGGFYIYAPEHQNDDTRSIKSLKAGLTRAILPRLPNRLRCSIFRPDTYQVGAWRVEMRLPLAIQRAWNGSPLQFNIPALKNRHFIIPSEFSFGPTVGRFVDGLWKANLYSNGIEEALNPTSLSMVKKELLNCVNEVIAGNGYGDTGELFFIKDTDGKIAGSTQFKNGRFEAWTRARSTSRVGNSHKFLGYFSSLDESIIAIRASR